MASVGAAEVTRDEFDASISGLRLLRNPPPDVEDFWELFNCVPSDEFAAGVQRARRHRVFFPVPAELFEDCETARPVRVWDQRPRVDGPIREEFISNPFGGEGITIKVAREWRYNCQACFDGGWLQLWCGAGDSAYQPGFCGREREHSPHVWAKHCACWDTNPDVVKRREMQAKSAIVRTERR